MNKIVLLILFKLLELLCQQFVAALCLNFSQKNLNFFSVLKALLCFLISEKHVEIIVFQDKAIFFGEPLVNYFNTCYLMLINL